MVQHSKLGHVHNKNLKKLVKWSIKQYIFNKKLLHIKNIVIIFAKP